MAMRLPSPPPAPGRSIRALLAGGAAGLALVVAGCASGHPAAPVDDATLRLEVLARLAASERVSPFQVDVQVTQGTARLSGVVDEEATRQAAEAEARALPGMRGVIDELRVAEPPGAGVPDDASLAATVRAKLTASPRLEPFAIEVAAARRVVSLTGRVPGPAERVEAERITRATAGVIGVRNLLQVGPAR
jgi:osmotically-inducible protein OsmY